MIAYVTVGADDLDLARRFYSALLPRLGYEFSESDAGLSFALPEDPALPARLPDFYVKPTFDGRPASAGNGAWWPSRRVTRRRCAPCTRLRWPRAGATSAPGFRAAYGPRFYVAYLRDPQGNKIALFSSNPDDPRRPDPA
jgi:catechol 2,3-dioxygenase-like lactoylglutathione lyase family enzyme